MVNYVTEQMLYCIRTNGKYPQEIQHSSTVWLNFGSIGLSVIRAYPKKTVEKRINGWQGMSAREINNALNAAIFKEVK